MRHFGRLMVMRPHSRKTGFYTSEWLNGRVEKSDAEDEARALLDDPRDLILGVYFWSLKFEQYDGKWLKRERES